MFENFTSEIWIQNKNLQIWNNLEKHIFRYEIRSEKLFVKLYFMHFEQTLSFFSMFLQYAIMFRSTSGKKNFRIISQFFSN